LTDQQHCIDSVNCEMSHALAHSWWLYRTCYRDGTYLCRQRVTISSSHPPIKYSSVYTRWYHLCV